MRACARTPAELRPAAVKRSPLLPIFLIVLVDILGMTIILPLLPFYAEHFGASAQTATLLISTYAACQLVAGPLLGRMSDRTGRKPLLLVSQMGTFLGFLLLANAWTLWVVFASRIIDGLTAGNLSLAQAYIADVTAPKERTKAFAVIGIAFGVGFLIGPAISGYLAQFGYQYPIYVAAGLSFTSIVCTATLLPRNPPRPEGILETDPAPVAPGGKRLSVLAWDQYLQYFRRPGLGSLLGQFFIFCCFFSMFTSGFALFAEHRPQLHFGVKQVGYVFAYAGFLGIILQGGLIGRLAKRFGDAALVSAGFLGAAIGYYVLSASYGIPVLLVAASISSVGTGLLRPALTSLITQQVSRSEQGTVLGLNQSLMSVAAIGAPALAGFLINRGWLSVWAATAATLAVVGLLMSRKDAALAREAGKAARAAGQAV